MPAIIGGAMVGGALIGGIGSAVGNKQAADRAEENYKHRYQWQVKDLKKAGLNPMLAYMNPAPNVPQAPVENIGEAAVKGGQMASSAAMAAKLGQAQLTNLAFDTDLKNNQSQVAANTARGLDIDNELKAAQLPYGADRARLEMERLSADVANLGHVAQNSGLQSLLLSQDVEFSRLDREQKQTLNAIEIRYRSYMAEQARLGIPAAQADAKFWETAGMAGKVAEKVKGLIPGIGHIGPKIFKR